MQTTSAKSVTPSMRAAAMIMEVRMSAADWGCRAVPSMAAAASFPMPAAPPMMVRPAPMPASSIWAIAATSWTGRAGEST